MNDLWCFNRCWMRAPQLHWSQINFDRGSIHRGFTVRCACIGLNVAKLSKIIHWNNMNESSDNLALDHFMCAFLLLWLKTALLIWDLFNNTKCIFSSVWLHFIHIYTHSSCFPIATNKPHPSTAAQITKVHFCFQLKIVFSLGWSY